MSAHRHCISAGVIAALGALHLIWAAGSSWPARTPTMLARAVIGAERMPSRVACVTVGFALLAAAFAAKCSGAARLLLALGFAARAVVGGESVARRFSGQAPDAAFQRLDARLHRPFCPAITVALAP